MFKQLCVFSFFFSFLFQNFAQNEIISKSLPFDEKSVPRENYVDFTHLKLALSFNPEEGKIFGEVQHTFIPKRKQIDTLFLDGPGIQINSITHKGNPIKFKSYAQGHTLIFNEPLTWDVEESVNIVYTANPRKGLYFIGWNDKTQRSRKQIWSQGQGIDNRHWIPMYDEMNDKVISEMIVTMPKPYSVLSNGVQQSVKENEDGTQTWHYKMSKPHAPYLIMLGIGEYKVKEIRSKSGVKMSLWYYPDHEDRYEYIYKYSAEMFDYFEQEIGVPYPWETYAQIPVQNFLYGAMENTTATVFGDFFCVDARGYLDRNYVSVNAHELAHQWFGDLVTARSSTHHWLQESFATHYNWLFERIAFGDDHFHMARRNANQAALNASKKDMFPVGHSKGGSTRHYPKGAFVIEMLKHVTGREAYNRAVKNYLQRHAYENVNSQDLLVAFHETLGYSLDWFWEQWIYRGGEPEYKITTELLTDKQQFVFNVQQTHDTSDLVKLFKMPIDFEVHYTDGTSEMQNIWIENQQHQINFTLKKGKKIAFYLFDPNNQILKLVNFEKPLSVLNAQLLSAPHMLDRLDAAIAMREFPLNEKSSNLLNVLKKEQSHYVKAEILKQLSGEEIKKVKTIFTQALSDKNVNVRKAALASFDKIPVELKSSVEQLLQDSSYQIVEEALIKLSKAFPEELPKYLEQTKNETGILGMDLRFTWLELSIPRGNSFLIKELTDYASSSFDFNVRRNALGVMRRLKIFNKDVLENALDASFDTNSRLASGAIGFLNYFYKNNADFTSLINSRFTKGQWNDNQLKVWERIREK